MIQPLGLCHGPRFYHCLQHCDVFILIPKHSTCRFGLEVQYDVVETQLMLLSNNLKIFAQLDLNVYFHT